MRGMEINIDAGNVALDERLCGEDGAHQSPTTLSMGETEE